MRPKISVITSVVQRKYLPEAIESITKQTFGKFEFLIVDDASSDGALEVIKHWADKDKRIKLIVNKKRLGLTKSLNKAIAMAKGDYVARMDGDDISCPNRLEKQFIFMEAHPEISFSGSWVWLIGPKGNKIKIREVPRKYKQIKKAALAFCPFIHPTLIFRKKVLWAEKGYSEDFYFAQDYELALRLLQKYRAENMPQPLVFYRVGWEKSTSFKNIKKQEWLAIKARWLALTKLGYPLAQGWLLLKPLLSYLLPAAIKIPLYKRYFWQ